MSQTHVPAALRRLVVERAGGRCEYCRVPTDVVFLPHEIDHVVAEKHGGPTDSENLALSCAVCNKRKGSDVASLDPETGEIVALFPHGKIHLETDPPLRLKPGAARLAQLTTSLIFPVHISSIRGQGHIIRGLLLRSRAQLRLFSPLSAEGKTTEQVLQALTEILDPKVSRGK